MAFKIGRYIMNTRQDVQVDPDVLATQLGIDRTVLNNWELDVSHPNMDALLILARQLDVDVRRLIGLKDTRGRSLFHPFAKKDALQWHHQGSLHRQQALSIILAMAADLDATKAPVRAVLANYYELLMQERDTRTDMVINAQNVKLAQAMDDFEISAASRAQYQQLLKLAMESLGAR